MDAPYNFCAGPGTLPPEAREALRADLLDWQGLGRGVAEVSHRSDAYRALQAAAVANLRALLGVGEEREILFLQGGASGQFALLPLNFLRAHAHADYVVRGYWADKAARQAARVGAVRTLPAPEEGWGAGAAYAHVTPHETLAGTRLPEAFPAPAAPLCADMSSDILAAPRDFRRYALAYAGAQKNLGVAGLAVVVAEHEFLARARRDLPMALCYLEHVRADGLCHTPNAIAVDALFHVTQWLLREGPRAVWERNARKAERLYAELDRSAFWRPLAPRGERSLTNVTFRLPTAGLEEAFLAQAEEAGLVGLRGHRALGGIRASLYNAMPEAGVEALVAFMRGFERANG